MFSAPGFLQFALSLPFVQIRYCGSVVERELHAFDAHAPEQVETLFEAVGVAVDHAFYARLNNELAALDAGRGCYVQRRAVAVVGALGDLGYRIGFGVEHVWLGFAHVVLAHVLEAGGRAVVAVGYYHLVLDQQCAYLAPHAV